MFLLGLQSLRSQVFQKQSMSMSISVSATIWKLIRTLRSSHKELICSTVSCHFIFTIFQINHPLGKKSGRTKRSIFSEPEENRLMLPSGGRHFFYLFESIKKRNYARHPRFDFGTFVNLTLQVIDDKVWYKKFTSIGVYAELGYVV